MLREKVKNYPIFWLQNYIIVITIIKTERVKNILINF